jgi:hypothetical protein
MIISEKQIVQLMFWCKTFQLFLIESLTRSPEAPELIETYDLVESLHCEIINQQSEELKVVE